MCDWRFEKMNYGTFRWPVRLNSVPYNILDSFCFNVLDDGSRRRAECQTDTKWSHDGCWTTTTGSERVCCSICQKRGACGVENSDFVRIQFIAYFSVVFWSQQHHGSSGSLAQAHAQLAHTMQPAQVQLISHVVVKIPPQTRV